MDITVYLGFSKLNSFTPSSYVSKLEFRLRLGTVSHTLDAGSPLEAPRVKIPYVALSKQSETSTPPTMLRDSGLIARALVSEDVIGDLNTHLSPMDKARDLALIGLLEIEDIGIM